jgi:hypothetical protein
MGLTESEFAVLRQTISTRGTVRIILLPVTLLGWGALVSTFLITGHVSPLASTLSLAAVAAGFEAIHALHVGVERIGRYLQVYYEVSYDGPQWETTCMLVGPALPGGGVDPLFTLLLGGATIANLMPLFAVASTPVELTIVGLLHGLFLVRLVRARWAAARQRAVELESYRAIRSGGPRQRS